MILEEGPVSVRRRCTFGYEGRSGGGELGFSEAAAEDEVKLSMMC